MAYSIEWLTSEVAGALRFKRLTESQEHLTHNYVVHIELNGNPENLERFQEIDADDITHALALTKSWVMVHNATSVAIRKVNQVGGLGSPDIYDWSDFADEDESIWWDLVEGEQ